MNSIVKPETAKRQETVEAAEAIPSGMSEAPAPAYIASHDPVVDLATELVPLREEYYATDERKAGAQGVERTYLSDHMNQVSDLIDAIEDRIAAVKATSMTGAIVQMRLAFYVLCMAYDGDRVTEGDYRKITRLLYSAAEVLEAETGTSRHDLAGEHHMNIHLDPHLSVEAQLAAIGFKPEPVPEKAG